MDERGSPDDRFMYKDGLSYGLWCLFLFGFAGVHRIYLGKYGTGIIWMLTFGLLGIGQFIDLDVQRRLVEHEFVPAGDFLEHGMATNVNDVFRQPAAIGSLPAGTSASSLPSLTRTDNTFDRASHVGEAS